MEWERWCGDMGRGYWVGCEWIHGKRCLGWDVAGYMGRGLGWDVDGAMGRKLKWDKGGDWTRVRMLMGINHNRGMRMVSGNETQGQ